MIKIDWKRAIAEERFFGFFYYTEVSYYEMDGWECDTSRQCISWSLDCLLKRGQFKDAIIIYRLNRG